jgi:CRISPR system Cascade subunit CasA
VLNLLTDPWIPVIRQRSGRCIIRPAEIADRLDDDPVMAVDWPRPDFRVATLEFLTGLLATAFPPEESSDWLEFWREPPEPRRLDEAFRPLLNAFNLDGGGPCFLQDMENLDVGGEPIERLLIEAPGDSTTSKNTDLLVHRDRIASISRAAAAMALYTFQSWAPAGGAGNRTGLRGGGPLVTMVLPGTTPTLWQTLWANVPTGGEPPKPKNLPMVFPWLAPTVTSEAGAPPVTPQSAHPLQCWWGMPRRIRLDFTTYSSPRSCDLTGTADDIHVATWRQRPRGANYGMWGSVHPLTPHYQQKTGMEKLPVHPQPGGIGYQHWLGLVMASPDGLRLPAHTVTAWKGRGPDVQNPRARLMVAGYDMDNMKARGFVESAMPLPSAGDKARQEQLEVFVRRLVEAADLVASQLRRAVRDALFSPGASVKSDASVLGTARERFWSETEPQFFTLLEAMARKPVDVSSEPRTAWLQHLRVVALALFDEAAPLLPDSDAKAAQRIGKARRFLGVTLAGYGPGGAELFEKLDLPRVQPKETKKKRKSS